VSSVPIPWCYERARRDLDIFGDEYWPYGIEPNRKTLDAFLQYASEQGVTHQQLQPEDIFARQVQQRFRLEPSALRVMSLHHHEGHFCSHKELISKTLEKKMTSTTSAASSTRPRAHPEPLLLSPN